MKDNIFDYREETFIKDILDKTAEFGFSIDDKIDLTETKELAKQTEISQEFIDNKLRLVKKVMSKKSIKIRPGTPKISSLTARNNDIQFFKTTHKPHSQSHISESVDKINSKNIKNLNSADNISLNNKVLNPKEA